MLEVWYSCGKCLMEFADDTELLVHLRSYHAVESNVAALAFFRYKCTSCKRVFKLPKDMQIHMSSCAQREAKKKALLAKLKTPTQKTAYPCYLCRKLFLNSAECKKHVNDHRKDKPFSCIECGKDFWLKRLWLSHLAKKHKSKTDVRSQKQKSVMTMNSSKVLANTVTAPKI